VFTEYQDGRPVSTLRAQRAALDLFSSYLADVPHVQIGDLFSDPQGWAGVTWGLVAGFRKWQLGRGDAVRSINARLSHVRVYARLAMTAGVLEPDEYTRIQTVQGYKQGDAENIDAKRRAAGLGIRRGHKKAEHVRISEQDAERLRTEHANDPQGRRDRLIMCLLCEWGPRVSELADLTVSDVDLDAGTLHLYRRKVKGTDQEQANLDLTTSPATLDALSAYGGPTEGALLVGSTRRGALTNEGMSTRAIRARVRTVGRRVLGVDNLTPHDLRHYAATELGHILSTRQLMDIFGWSSPAMAVRYQESARRIGRTRNVQGLT